MEEDGILAVKFKIPEAAVMCVNKMNGRFYDGRVVGASVSTGEEKFKRAKRDTEQEEKDRHEEYGRWLDSEEKSESL